MDSSASSGGTWNSIIFSRAANTASMRRRFCSGVELRASVVMSPRISSLTRSPGAPVCTAITSRYTDTRSIRHRSTTSRVRRLPRCFWLSVSWESAAL